MACQLWVVMLIFKSCMVKHSRLRLSYVWLPSRCKCDVGTYRILRPQATHQHCIGGRVEVIRMHWVVSGKSSGKILPRLNWRGTAFSNVLKASSINKHCGQALINFFIDISIRNKTPSTTVPPTYIKSLASFNLPVNHNFLNTIMSSEAF